MKKNKTHAKDLTQGPIFKDMIAFAIPVMLGGVLQILFNTADTVVVGRFAGKLALAAVGSNSSLVFTITNLFIGLSVGANIACAKYFGAQKFQEVHDTAHTSILVSLLSGVFLTVFGIVFAPTFLRWMSVPDDVMALSVLYLRIYFLGMPAMMLYNFGSALLRSVGDTTRTLYYLTASGIINVILNLIFVIVFDMSVAGVAIATVVSQCISAVLVLRCLMKEESCVRINLRELKIYPARLAEIVKIGIPASLQGMVFSFSNLAIQAAVNGFGSVAVAGNSAASSVEGFIYLPVNAFYQAVMPFTSQNLGAEKYDRLGKVFRTAALSVFIVGEIIGIGSVLASKPLLSIFTTDAAVVASGQIRMNTYFFLYGLYGLMEVCVGSLRGLGYSTMPTVVYAGPVCGIRLLWLATVFKIGRFHTLRTVYLAFPVTWVITLPILLGCYFYAYRKVMRTAKPEKTAE